MKLKSSVLPLFLLSCSGAYVQNQNISNGFMFDGEPFLAINEYITLGEITDGNYVIKVETSYGIFSGKLNKVKRSNR